jgi:hypothetical protein
MSEKYNGWTNYETWLVALWLDNDEGSYNEMHYMARHSKDVYSLMEQIKEMIEELNPLKDQANLFSDLLNGAISECNFYEIAEHYYEAEKDNTEENSEEDE